MIETIVSAALKFDDGLIVSKPQPARHFHIMHPLWEHLGDKNEIHGMEQGFLTSEGRFVDREEGCLIARLAGQIKHKTGPDDILFSECMW